MDVSSPDPGVGGSRRLVGSVVRGLMSRAGRVVDRRYGVETADTTSRAELGYDRSQRERKYYAPSQWRALPVAIPRRSVGPDDVFVDLGSGKGRVVLQAARHYPFRRVIGVECSPELTARAADNLVAWRGRLRCRDVELVTEDATLWDPPADLTVAYLHNPFSGDVFAAAVHRLVRLVERTGSPLRIVYVNPREHEALVATEGIAEVAAPPALLLKLNGIPAGSIRRYEITP